MKYLPFTFLVVVALLGSQACSGPSASLSLISTVNDSVLTPGFGFAVYRPIDRNTADVFVSDLPIERLIDLQDSLTGTTGCIIHLHVFLVPTAGRTPIEITACNFSVRQIIVAGDAVSEKSQASTAGSANGATGVSGIPAMGLYGGGGFMMPGSDSGNDVFGGTIHDATLRLARATGDFSDRLGVSRLTGSFSALRDDATAKALADRVEQIARSLPEKPE